MTYIFDFFAFALVFAFFGSSGGRRLVRLTLCHLTGNLTTHCHGYLERQTAHIDACSILNSVETTKLSDSTVL